MSKYVNFSVKNSAHFLSFEQGLKNNSSNTVNFIIHFITTYIHVNLWFNYMIYTWIHRCYLVNTCKLWENAKCVSQDSSLEHWTFNWKVISLSKKKFWKVITDPKVPAHLNEKREVRWGWARGHYRLQWNGRKNWASPEAEQKDPEEP